MSLSLLEFNNEIMEIILKNIDEESHLIVGLVSKELYKTLKELNPTEKLIGSLRYLSSNLNLLKYANKNGCPLNLVTIKNILNITNKESLECLKYVHRENGCHWSKWTCNFAALHGHLECLKYLHENGCPWSEGTCDCAAMKGQLECLKYLHENGCPWSKMTCGFTIEYGQLECLQYCRDNGCPE